MNKERIQNLITHMEEMPNHAFDMNQWMRVEIEYQDPERDGESYTGFVGPGRVLAEPERFGTLFREKHVCGTVGCIAGHAIVIAMKENAIGKGFTDYDSIIPAAGAYLDLTMYDARELFKARALNGNFDSVTKQQAINVLKHLRDTGDVDWDMMDSDS